MIFGSFRKCFLAKKVRLFSRHFSCAGQIHEHIAQFFFIFEKSEKSELSLRFQNKPHERVSVGFCPFWSMTKPKTEAFEKREKIEILVILGTRFPSEAIFAQEKFWPIFGLWSVFDRHIARNLIFTETFENASIDVNHTST